ncbi:MULTISPECIES: glycosyltransferase [Candidatus Nitrosocaldus]|jgi:UDP-N-acetylglucosamine--N-acetylmuramyl-(pentapeptide) pyrophosphoryl-undecaprenol N-acetylglucosamine transferase|uniref:UDP-glucuronosyltransferase n=1 Tax=Candidatus Nitrosocaldus cavascurensis TaxID=2058097 RepID=A0A2K5AS08_9ARCH|nr:MULTISPECIES: glycosyltransferase [Candidatus Nitrosocaldus]SPC34436.1 UDP-glucuronosyltransferase [Candidatus Nitrosocaldus cavascurensis]
MVRILFFTSPIGLGHASRDIAVVDELVSKGIDMDEIAFVTGGVAYKHLRAHGYNVVEAYRGKSIDASNGIFSNRLLWLLDYISFYRECKEIASSLIDEYRPELIVSDEDFASIAVAKMRGIKNVLITDVLESRFLHGPLSLVERFLNRHLRDIIAGADMVIVPMYKDEHKHTYTNVSNTIITYVGPIVRRVSKDRDELRRLFGFHGYKTILVSVGGTSSGTFLIEKAIDSYMRIVDRFNIPTKMVIVCGPAIDISRIGSNHVNNNDRRIMHSIELHGYVKNMHEMIYAADLLISLAGRSSMDEARVYGTPAILIPINGHFEQEDNARSYGFFHSDVERLEDLIFEYLAYGRREVRDNNGGAVKAADTIIKLLT